MQVDPDKFWAELEQAGEDRVRKNVASQQVYSAPEKELATEWLRRKTQARSDAANLEQRTNARHAKYAAITAAIAATVAAICAVISLFRPF